MDGPNPLKSKRSANALHIQAAAIAAQQIALEEEEIRLAERRHALERQEEQLAAHLADKQRQVQTWSEQVAEQAEELDDQRQRLDHQRTRVRNIIGRLRERSRQQQEADERRRLAWTAKLHAEAQAIQEGQALLAAREAAHAREIIHFNTERELATRQLAADEERLREQRQAWRQRRSLERAALRADRIAVAADQAKLQQAANIVQRDVADWNRQQELLQKELHGLNNRVVHQRLRILEQQEELARLETALAERKAALGEAVEVEVLGEAVNAQRPAPAELDRLADELADQRLHLAEQFARMALLHEAWQQQRDAAAADLDRLALELAATEETLSQRDRQTILIEQSLQERQEEIDAARQDLHIWRAQRQAQEASFAHEQHAHAAALHEKERLLNEQLTRLAELRQRWNARRQQEVQTQQTLITLLDERRQRMQELQTTLLEKNVQAEDQKRLILEKSLALEQYGQEILLRANDPESKQRVETLRRRWLTLNATVVRRVRAERDALARELSQWDAHITSLLRQVEQATLDSAALAEKQRILDEREVLMHSQQSRLSHEQQTIDAERLALQHHREQIELMARATYDYSAPAIEKAA